MKLVKILFLSVMCMFLAFPTLGFAQTQKTDKLDKQTQAEVLNEMKDLLSKNNIEVDLSNPNEKVEKVVKNEKGEEVGTLGVELVNSQETTEPINNGDISINGTTSLTKGKTYTFKVYWYAATVNYQFYTDVYVSTSTGLGKIVAAYDPWYMVIPPGVVSRDTLSIIRQYETSSYAAEARYTLNMSAPVSTSLYIYGKVKDSKFITGGN